MAERRSFDRRDNRRGNDRRSQERQFENRRVQYDDDDEPILFKDIVPRTNAQLLGAYRKDAFPELGMTINEMEISSHSVEIEGEERGYTVRKNERSPGDDRPTLQEITEQELIGDQKNDALEIKGDQAPQIGTVLILRDRDGLERAVTFSRPELETFGRKKSGPTGMMNDLPGRQATEEINQEHLIIGKTSVGGERVIVAVDTGEPSDLQISRIIRGKQNIIRMRQRKLQSLLQDRHTNIEAIRKATADASELARPLRVVFVKKKPLNAELSETLIDVETEIGPHRERIKGIVYNNFAERKPTIVAPICIEPEANGIESDSLQFLDATGQEREIELIEDADNSQLEYVKAVARRLGKPKLAQTKAQGPVVLSPPEKAQILHDPTTVLPLKKAA